MLDISIVVPVRLARETIGPTLEALLAQCGDLGAEVIAVVSRADPSVAALEGLSDPRLRVIQLDGSRSVPQLRAEGIRAARGRLVAITEDHCLFSPGWVHGLIEAHAEREVAAVGGPVENGRCGGPIDWAIYFSRYLVWMPPLAAGAVTALPGNNACYRRDVLGSCRELYAHGFWEHDFNREITARGLKMWMAPGLVVTHNKPYRFFPYVALRYRHARCFGGMLAARLSPAKRLRRIVLSPLIPLALLARANTAVTQKKRRQREFLLALPALLVFYLVWFWGELVGYVVGPGETCSQTD